MIPGTIFDIFQPTNDFFYGLDVEIRPKLTPRAGTPRWSLARVQLLHTCWGEVCSPSSFQSVTTAGRKVTELPPSQIPIPPPRVDSSKGPPGCTCAGGQFRPNLNIQPIKKIIHGLENIKNSAGNHLHPFFTFFEWLDAIFKITPSFQPPHLF